MIRTMHFIYKALKNSHGHLTSYRTLTAQGIRRKAEPWPVSAAIVRASTAGTQSEMSAGRGQTSRAATGRPTAAERHARGRKSSQHRSTQAAQTSEIKHAYLLQTLVFGSKLLQFFYFLKRMRGLFSVVKNEWPIKNYQSFTGNLLK